MPYVRPQPDTQESPIGETQPIAAPAAATARVYSKKPPAKKAPPPPTYGDRTIALAKSGPVSFEVIATKFGFLAKDVRAFLKGPLDKGVLITLMNESGAKFIALPTQALPEGWQVIGKRAPQILEQATQPEVMVNIQMNAADVVAAQLAQSAMIESPNKFRLFEPDVTQLLPGQSTLFNMTVAWPADQVVGGVLSWCNKGDIEDLRKAKRVLDLIVDIEEMRHA